MQNFYKVFLQVGGRLDLPFSSEGVKVELLANNIALPIYNLVNPIAKAGDLATWSITYDSSGIAAGADLKIQISSQLNQIDGAPQTIYDNVTLAVFPKPPTPVTTGSIHIPNGNFNLPQASSDGWSAGTGWSKVSKVDGAPSEDPSTSGVEQLPFSKFTSDGGWDQTRTAYAQGGLFSTGTLAFLRANSTYQLTLQVGERKDYGSGFDGMIVELRAGTTVLTPTAVVQPAPPSPKSGTFALWSYSYTTTNIAPSLIGQDLKVRLGRYGPQPIFDNVELSVASLSNVEKFTRVLEETPGNIALTWTSQPNRSYTLKTSKDLVSWPNTLSSSIQSGGPSTSFTHTLPFPRPVKLFYQVYENPIAQ